MTREAMPPDELQPRDDAAIRRGEAPAGVPAAPAAAEVGVRPEDGSLVDARPPEGPEGMAVAEGERPALDAKSDPGGEAPDEEPTGFVLRRLLVLGSHAEPAILEFSRGLNVITGSSDTGKSFAVECIDFMLGAQDPPRPIPHARPYDKVALEIESAAGEVVTIERALEGGRVRWYPAAFADITAETPFEELAWKHSPTSQKTLSFRLLALCGLAGRVLRKNSRNETRTLSFRNVAKLVLVDEERVIARRSPVLGDVLTDAPADKALFTLLLTGKDDAGLVAQADTTERKARLIAQVDLLDGMLGPAPPTDAPPPPDRVELTRQREALRAHVDELTDVVTAQSRAIDEATAESAAVVEAVVASKSRLLVVGELLSRFALLRRSYETDLERLEFVAEGHHYFAQLSTVVCPGCNRPLGDGDGVHAFCEQGSAVADDVQAACSREAAKIRGHLRDLEAAVADLDRERAELGVAIRAGTERYRRLEAQVERDLRPRLSEAAEALKQSMATRYQVVQEEAALDHRMGLLEKKLELERLLQEIGAVADAPVREDDVPYQALADAVSELLRAWRYPAAGEVRFDDRRMDLVVDGEARQTHGKGIRAIMYAAFTIGLMRFCRSHDLPHPGFVVLDSPLTTYRRRGTAPSADMDAEAAVAGEAARTASGAAESAEAEREAPEDMQRAFFEYLADSAGERGEQVVIFENKEPPADVIARARYVQFTGIAGTGRAGFMPV
ncbi:MAG TPA: AAA family ATPase [Gemmatimonadaceae bacterium]|nr:AAA family ATPase [Gemmatimonadaceae bacterium]